MSDFPHGFLVGDSTSPHRVQGDTTTSDCWVRTNTSARFPTRRMPVACHRQRVEGESSLRGPKPILAWLESVARAS
jgi:hypothetical protein